ncbi:MAG: M1 family metallopeptidase [Gemmatimonadota bacterium]
MRASRAPRIPPSVVGALILVSVAGPVAAQSLYTPRAIERTYDRGTRSLDGNPGPAYWQNRGRYTIAIRASPPDRNIEGTETITYFNDSPDTLSNLVIRLFNNIHKPGAPRNGGAPPGFLTSGVHIRSFTVNGESRPWADNPRTFTVARVRLPRPLMPRDSVRLGFDWDWDVSVEPGREGSIDSTTFYLAYFYPRVAVYDDYDGWDTMDHAGHEFYSDFNDYDVTVTVPGTYAVWGTGTLANADAVLQPAALGRYRTSMTSDTTVVVGTGEEIRAGTITTPNPTNEWHFTSSNVPDVAFGLSDHYAWEAASVVVEDATGRRVSAQAAYSDDAPDVHEMVGHVRHSLDFLSHQWPGVPYPWEKMTAFEGGAGMEYPMMANDQAYDDPAFSLLVVAHEIAHTYMPFYMGINETRYAFMDEGWATTFEYLINSQDMGVERASEVFKAFRVNNWAQSTTPVQDLPIITPADVLTGGAYGINAYGKPALGYLAVKDMLGDDLFRRCLHAYVTRWNGKHPTPWDFFYTFDDVAGRPLDWFWSNWFFSNHYIDLGIGTVDRTGDGYAIAVENVGGMAAPFDLVLTWADGTTTRQHQTAAAWRADPARVTVTVPAAGALRAARIDGGIWVDADASNDGWEGS